MNVKEDKTPLERQFEKVVNRIAIIVVIAFLFSTAFFWVQTGASPLKTNEIGQIGDFFGGTLNPLFTFITIALLVWSIRIQMGELSATRQELKCTREELERSAVSHREMVDQGNANFFIEQAVKSFEASEIKINNIMKMKIILKQQKNLDDLPVVYGNVFPQNTRLKDGVKISEISTFRDEFLLRMDGLESGIFTHAQDSLVIDSFVQCIRHELINLCILIENKGWSHAITCLDSLLVNLSVLKYFRIHLDHTDFIKGGIKNAFETVSDDLIKIKSSEEKYATLRLANEVAINTKKLHELLERNVYGE